MRKGEILNCRKKWVDLNKGYINILESKNGKSREIPISSTLRPILQEAMKNDTDYVFVNPETNEPYVDIKHSFTAVLNKANIKNFSFHCCRHTFATRLLQKGVDMRTAQELLGHSDIRMTERYTHTNKEKKIEAVNLL